MNIIKYTKDSEDLDILISSELEKIWWDVNRDNNYECSLIRNDIEYDTIANAYAYKVENDRILYTTIIKSDWREYTYNLYESICNQNFDFNKQDSYTYTLKYYHYFKGKLSIRQLSQLLKDIESFKKINVNLSGCKESLEEYTSKSFQYGKHNKRTVAFITEVSSSFNDFSFCQGNSNLDRLLVNNGLVFFDYIAFYNKPFPYSYLKDYAQLLISLKSYNHYLLSFMIKQMNKIKNKKGLVMYILLEDICIETKEYFMEELK